MNPWLQSIHNVTTNPIRSTAEVVTHKCCIGCEEVKPIEDFYTANGRPKSYCKKCAYQKVKEHRQKTATPRLCVVCGQEFHAKSGRINTCGPVCKYKRMVQKRLEREHAGH